MRLVPLLALFAAAACGDDGPIRVVTVNVLANGATVYATMAPCECATVLEPPLTAVETGSCVTIDAPAPPCECFHADPCVADATVAPMDNVSYDGHTIRGNALGRTLTLAGCGEPVDIALPEGVPNRIQITDILDLEVGREVSFTADGTAGSVLGTVGGSNATEPTTLCRVPADAGKLLFPDLAGATFTLRTESPPVITHTPIGDVIVTALNGAAQMQ